MERRHDQHPVMLQSIRSPLEGRYVKLALQLPPFQCFFSFLFPRPSLSSFLFPADCFFSSSRTILPLLSSEASELLRSWVRTYWRVCFRPRRGQLQRFFSSPSSPFASFHLNFFWAFTEIRLGPNNRPSPFRRGDLSTM